MSSTTAGAFTSLKETKQHITRVLKHLFGEIYQRKYFDKLQSLGVTSLDHLTIIDPTIYQTAFLDVPVVATKLSHLATYLRLGNQSVTSNLTDCPTPTKPTPSLKPSFAKSASKKLRDFDGDLSQWRAWKRHAVNFFGIIGAFHILELPDTASTDAAINELVYFHLTKAVADTQLHHIAQSFEATCNGHGLWMAICKWMETDSTKKALASEAKTRKEQLCLNTNTTAGDYIQAWQDVLMDLEEAGEPLTEPAVTGKFLTQVTDPEYKAIVTLRHDQKLDFAACSKKICKHVLMQAWANSRTKSQSTVRRTQPTSNQSNNRQSKSSSSSSSSGSSTYNFPSIPRQFKEVFSPDLMDILYKWRAHCLNPHTANPYNFKVETLATPTDARPSKRAQRVTPQDSASPSATTPSVPDGNDESETNRNPPSSHPTRRITFNKCRAMNGQPKSNKRNNNKSSADNRVRRFRRVVASQDLALDSPPTTSHAPYGLDPSPSPLNHMLIDDTAAEQHLFGPAFEMLSFTGARVQVQGALHDMLGLQVLQEGTGCTVVEFPTCPTVDPIILVIPHGLYSNDPHQVESLFHTHQARSTGAVVNNCAAIHQQLNRTYGTQAVYLKDNVLPFEFDGTKCFWQICKPTKTDKATLQWMQLSDFSDWHPKPSSTICRLKTLRPNQAIWALRLLFAPDEVVLHTLANTTQFYDSIKAETRDLPRWHFKTRTFALRLQHLNKEVYTDTFFSDTTSVRGHTCVQGFLGADTGYLCLYPMKRKSHAHKSLADFLRFQGRPTCLVSNNAGEETGPEWTLHCQKALLPQWTTPPHGQNSNKMEQAIQNIKRILDLTLQRTAYDIRYWCYLAEQIALAINHQSVKQLSWKTPTEMRLGITPDLSMFRFTFWDQVEYLDVAATKTPFPNSRMFLGRYLGLAQNTGDAFTYYILPDPPPGSKRRPRVITQDVVRGVHPLVTPTPIAEPLDGKLPTAHSVFLTQTTKPTESCTSQEEDNTIEDPNLNHTAALANDAFDSVSIFSPPRKTFTKRSPKRKHSSTDLPSNALHTFTHPQLGTFATITASPTSHVPDLGPDEQQHEDADASDISILASNPLPHLPSILAPVTTPGGTDPDKLPEVTQDDDDPADDCDSTNFADLPAVKVLPDVHNHFQPTNESKDLDNIFEAIVDHRWEKGTLLYHVQWKTGLFTWVPHGVLCVDLPMEVATYILNNRVEGTQTGALSHWA